MKKQRYRRSDKNIVFKAEEFEDIKSILLNSREKYANQVAFQLKEKKDDKVNYINKTYNDLVEDIYSFGTYLYRNNYSKGKRIGVIGKNQYNWVVAHYTNLFGSIVSVPLDKDLKNEELLNSVKRAKLDALIFDSAKLENIEYLKENNVKCKFICMQDIENYDSMPKLIEEGNKLKKKYKDFINNKINNKDLAILLFTSGTTSAPKAIMLNNKNIACNIYALGCAEDVRSDDTNICFLPFHHIFGSTGLLFMLYSGVKNVFPDGLKYIKQNLVEYQVSVFVGVPLLVESIYNAIIKEIKAQDKENLVNTAIKINNITKKVGLDFSKVLFKQIIDKLGGKLRLIVVGRAPVRPEVIKGFGNLGISAVNGYGLSETSPVVCAENIKRHGGAGAPMCNIEVDIFEKDEEGSGEIIVKGPSVFMGYYKDEEKTKEVLKDGWFHTGDIGKIINGNVYITGRQKSMIVLNNGKKIFPEEVETLIDDLDLVSESIVFGYNKDNKVITGVKVVLDEEYVKNNYKNKTKQEIKEILWNQIKELNTKFPRYKHIQKLIISDEELVKTTTAKIKRFVENEKIKKYLDENE